MNESTTDKLPAVVSNSSSPDREAVTKEAKQQVQQLRTDADNMLMQLMLDQKAKLDEMVQQLQNPNESQTKNTTIKDVGGNNAAEEQPSSEGKNDVLADPIEPPEANVPLDDISKLQEGNMAHLDVVIDRINATMKSSMKVPTPSDTLNQGENTNGSVNTDI